MNVLIVQGDKRHGEMYQDAFESGGHDAFLALGAQAALHVLDKNKVDVIILDLILPGRSGVEVLQELVSYDDWANIPVLLITDNHPASFKISEGDMEKYSVSKLVFKQKTTPSELVIIAQEVVSESL